MTYLYGNPITITQSGVYQLQSDIIVDSRSGYGIFVAADDVVIDLNGFMIKTTAGADNNATGIYAFNRDNVTVAHGTIEGFLFGVRLIGNSNDYNAYGNYTVTNMTVRDSTARAIIVSGEGNTVTENFVDGAGGTTYYDNPFAVGIETSGPDALIYNNLVRDIYAGGTGEALGISVSSGGVGSRILSNRVENSLDPSLPATDGRATGSFGFWGGGNSDVLVSGNTFTNFTYGLVWSSVPDITFGGNFIDGTVTPTFASDQLAFNATNLGNTYGLTSGDDVFQTNDMDNRVFGRAGNDVIRGGLGNDQLFGEAGDDFLFGASGNDYLVGGPGNDHLEGGEGADVLIGGEGFDYASYSGASGSITASLHASSWNQGEAFGDTYSGIEGLVLGSHDDWGYGDANSNTIYGRQGNDVLFGMAGRDFLFGEEGDDNLVGGDGDDHLFGGEGQDLLQGGAGLDLARYDNETSGVVASLSTPWLNTGSAFGDQYLSIEGLSGTAFNDHLIGDGADNWLYGQAGDDFLFGESGNDYLVGGAGNDHLEGGEGADVLIGGEGFDYASYSGASWSVTASLHASGWNQGEAFGDTYSGIEGLVLGSHDDWGYGDANSNTIYGRQGNDVLFGMAGRDFLFGEEGDDNLVGGDGDDHLFGGEGQDLLQGGAGLDLARYDNETSGAVASLSRPWLNTGSAFGDQYLSIEGLSGTAFNDHLIGDGAGNWIYGQAGDDRIEGLAGNDTLWGGSGADIFVFNTAPSSRNLDTIVDFVSGLDIIELAELYFGAAFTGGFLSFVSGVNPLTHTLQATVIYDTASSILSFDQDGDGPGLAQPIAFLMNKTDLIADDFVMA